MPVSLSAAWTTSDDIAVTNAFALMCGHLLRLTLHGFVQEYDLKPSYRYAEAFLTNSWVHKGDVMAVVAPEGNTSVF
jgi:hypothetical protein